MAQNDDVLKQFIKDQTGGGTKIDKVNEVNMDTYKESVVYGREYISIDVKSLPAGVFYKEGTRISIRGASVAEVQEYSVVDQANIMDVTEKMNKILSRCVRFIRSDGTTGSYRDLKDNDRIFLIFMIRELTFQKGNNLAKEVTCETCGHEFKIEYRATNSERKPNTFVNHEMNEEIAEFFNPDLKVFEFEIDDKVYRLSPPSIGLQESFFENLKVNIQENPNKKPNVSFLKIIPFTLYDRTTITADGIKAKEKEFSEMDMDSFQTLDYVIDRMEFGIKELNSKCPVCGAEVRTEMSFPSGAKSLFTVSSPLEKLKKK
jgi:hypothetical protein